MVEGKTIYTASGGLFMVDDVKFTSEPGTKHEIRLFTNGVDLN